VPRDVHEGVVNKIKQYETQHGRAMAEVVSRWLPTAAARVRARVWQVRFMVDKELSGHVFSKHFCFACQNRSFQQLLHRHHNYPGQLAEIL
jgi:hypothetical protein